MRQAMVNAFIELAEQDEDFVLLTGDLGYGVFEDYKKAFPSQYYNVGIAEQNMIGLASGLALEGKCVFVYSIGNFPTLRCLEQIRNDACYHELNVNIVCQGGGFSYGGLGMSHHATEDIAVIRALPNTTIVAPYSEEQTKSAVFSLSQNKSVGYLRLEKIEKNNKDDNFILGKASILMAGDEVAILSYGNVINECIVASNRLRESGVECAVINMHTVKPIDRDIVQELSKKVKLIITVEEHNVIGGLGSAVAEIISSFSTEAILKRLGLNDCYSSVVGDQKYLRKVNGLDSNSIVNSVKGFL